MKSRSIAFIVGLLITAATWAGTNSGGTATRVTPPGPTGYVVGNLIKSSEINGEYNDIYTELTDRVSRSGKGSMLANWAMNTHKLTGLAAGTVAGDSVEYSQFTTALAGKAALGANTDITSLNGPALGAASATTFTANVINTSQGADIASATTTNLETATGNYIHVTGTTTITGITLSQGRTRDVEFTGALTLTNGASLILPSGVNIATAAGDTATFVGEAAGVVRCVSYQRADGRSLTSQGIASGLITKSLSDASGTLVVSGLGFLPRFLKFTCSSAFTQAPISFGTFDGTTNNAVFFSIAGGSGAFNTYSLLGWTSAGNTQTGVVTAMSNGQFTITWTKAGTPSGNAYILWEAYQ